MSKDRKLRYGMIGGGPGAFIGAVHRHAIGLDQRAEIVAGAFSNFPEESREMGEELHLDEDRVYEDYRVMAETEAEKSEGERIDFVSVVTPNFLHYDVAKVFLEAGFHVVCEKPMTTTLEEAEDLCRLASENDRVFALMHNYTGYPMVKQARSLVDDGTIGDVRKVVVEYTQGWLATALEEEGSKQAEWRTDPDRAGVSSAIGDIGSHAENLARYVTGLEIDRLMADITTFVEGRALEDDANMILQYDSGAKGVLHCSQICVGEENRLHLRVYGTKASLEWGQEEPNKLIVRYPDRPLQVYTPGHEYLDETVQGYPRLPSGHPEGFLEAFGNIYRNAMATIVAREEGREPTENELDFPTVQDGAVGVDFIHKAVKSGKQNDWVEVNYSPPT